MTTTAFVSTYPPQRCGIATFTADLASAVGQPRVVALHPPQATIGRDPGGPPPHPPRRARRLHPRRPLARRAGVDVVSIQHEYGIWGGRTARTSSTSSRALRTPVVATLHTVLATPTPSQRRILAELVRRSGGDRRHVHVRRATC